MAKLEFFSGTMDSGKSTLALQMNHNHRASSRVGLIFTSHDRSGAAVLSSRLGLRHEAIEVTEQTNFWDFVVDHKSHGRAVHYLICDEAQFYTPAQIDQLAALVDEMSIDVYAFGITTDFQTSLFPGSRRLIELADHVHELQVEALCWCGRRATHNARTVDGEMVVTGEQVAVGDTDESATLSYEILCRKHYMKHLTAAQANQMSESDQLLPFELHG